MGRVSVLSVIVGFAAQNTLGNVIAGIALLIYPLFKVGDRLQVTAPTGLETSVVESLTLGYTLLKTDDNRRVVVPLSLMASQTAINLTGNDPRLICAVPIGIRTPIWATDIDNHPQLELRGEMTFCEKASVLSKGAARSRQQQRQRHEFDRLEASIPIFSVAQAAQHRHTNVSAPQRPVPQPVWERASATRSARA